MSIDNNHKKFVKKNIVNTDISEEMKNSYINYAMSVIVSRALPDVRDGLKPVQRRILYSMYTLGITHNKSYKKCARTVGDVIGKYHPHGDASVYDALVRMAQDFSLRYMLVEGQGNFGSIDGDGAAAMRYTESRLGKITTEMLSGLKKNTVNYEETYDGSEMEPKVLPATIPNLLLNGADGIAVGMATKIPPHNLKEIGAAIEDMIKRGNKWIPEDKTKLDTSYVKKIKTKEGLDELPKNRFPRFESEMQVDELMEFVPGPDFPTGASIYNRKEIANAYATGKGKILMRAIANIEEGKRGKFNIIISELPYQVNKARLVAKIAKLVKDKKIEDIADLRDESNKDGIRVVVETKRTGKPKTILNKLYKYTSMQKAFHANMLALVNDEPQVITLKRYFELFIRHRQEIVIRRSEFKLAEAREREHILEGLMIALDHLDEVIQTIRDSKDSNVAKQNLIKKLKLTEIQAQAILDMRLRRLAALERSKIKNEYEEIKKNIKKLITILETPEEILDIISKELKNAVEKFGDERRTKVYKGGVGKISEEDLVPNEKVIVSVTKQGYIKRMKDSTYSVQRRGGKGKLGMNTKEEDVIAHVFSAQTHDDILFFTSEGRVFQKKVYEIPEFGRTAKGKAIINLIDIEQHELITSILTRSDDGILGEDEIQEGQENQKKSGKKYKYLLMATQQGKVKKTDITEYEEIRSSGLIAINLSQGDKLIAVKPTTGDDEVLLITLKGRSIHFHEEEVRATGRATMGVIGIKFKDKKDKVISIDLKREDENLVLVVSEKGFGKVTPFKEYPIQGRGGQGVYTARLSKKTGDLSAARIIDHPNAKILIMSLDGKVVKIPPKDLPKRKRQTTGVKLMNISKNDKVAALALV